MAHVTDRIVVSDLRVEAHIGVTAEERSVAQSLSLNIELYLDLSHAAASDRLEDSVDYGAVTMSAAEQLRSNRRELLEAAAGDVLARLLQLPGVKRTAVELIKLHPPIPETVGPASVRLDRSVESDVLSEEVA